MTNEQKNQIKDALVRYAANFETQALAAESLEGVSNSTISQVKNNNWELLSERLWHNIARQVGFYCGEWHPADTSTHLLLRILFSDAQHYAMSYGIAMAAGLGKTFTASHYVRENEHVWYVAGLEQYNRKSFLELLLAAAGHKATGTVPHMMEQLAALVEEKDEPLIIVDDAHKLKDRVLHLVVQLSNQLWGKAGIIIMGNEQLRERVIEGVRLKKVGYDEIFRSIGRRFITLNSIQPWDVGLVCRANGVFDEDIIRHITNTATNLHEVTHILQRPAELGMAA